MPERLPDLDKQPMLLGDSPVLETEKLRARIKKLEQEKEILEQRIAGLYWLVDNKCRS